LGNRRQKYTFFDMIRQFSKKNFLEPYYL